MIPPPHGGKLVSIREAKPEDDLGFSPSGEIKVPGDVRVNVRLISRGVYSPLRGFNTLEETDSILREQRLPDGTIWSMPVLLPAGEREFNLARDGEEWLLKDDQGPVAVINITGRFTLDMHDASRHIFGTSDIHHPGVSAFLSMGNRFLAGNLTSVFPHYFPFQDRVMYPKDTRRYFMERGWKTVTAFQTRNIPHMGHEYMHARALESSDGLFINPVIGRKKSGDFRDEAIIAAYDALKAVSYPESRVLVSPVNYEMQYAGPREALHHAIMRKNYGASSFIVGRDHAGVGSYYGSFDAQRNCEAFPDLGIEILKFGEASYCTRCGRVTMIGECDHDHSDRIKLSGTDMRTIIRGGTAPGEMLMRKEVLMAVKSIDQPFFP